MFRIRFGKKKVPLFPSCVFYCLKEKCPLWVKLEQRFVGKDPIIEGRCAIAWLPPLIVELKYAIEKLQPKK